jgi:hypothetical protein
MMQREFAVGIWMLRAWWCADSLSLWSRYAAVDLDSWPVSVVNVLSGIKATFVRQTGGQTLCLELCQRSDTFLYVGDIEFSFAIIWALLLQ